ncbi:MAG TPA: hypothetical protein VKB34_11005 [Povalibacter sp.]|nr:hypothetical protein [Povalibacter sp.]
MSEHKGDELTATGTHRAWVGETGGTAVRAGNSVRDAQRSWLERAQPQPSNPRHAAITRSLYSWSNYKNWTDKVRHGWDKDKK